MIEDVRKFYIDTIAARETFIQPPRPPCFKVSPVTRFEFYTASAIATIFLIQKVAFVALFSIVTLLTCFLSQTSKDLVYQNCEEAKVYLGALFAGNVGFLFPGSVNEYFLGIPAEGLLIPFVRV